MKTGALPRRGAEPGVWAAGRSWRGRPGPGSPEQQAGAERSRVLQPPRSREPGQHPPAPRRDVSGATLKGAGRPPRVGAGAGGRGHRMGVPRRCWEREEKPQHPTGPNPGNPRACRDQETPGFPEGACEALKLSRLQIHRRRHTIPLACPCPGTTLPISPGGGSRTWGKGPPQYLLGSVVYLDCPLHAPHSQEGQGKEARRAHLPALCLSL